jgi:hypothetical protein
MGSLDYIRHRSKARILAGETVHWIENNKRAPYIRSAVLSAPPWVRAEEFAAIRAEATRLTEQTGELYVIDHIIPLRHPFVCGLTVPWNLQVVHWRHNGSKGNYFNPHQMELFDAS